MKMLIILFAATLAFTAYGQDYTFKVLISKGQNTMRSGNEWLPVKVGATLSTVDELRISPRGYLGLVHTSGKPLEVKEAGAHKVADLEEQVKTGVSVLNKYTDFLLSTTIDKGVNLTASGSVTRGIWKVRLYLPERDAIVLNDEVMISWSRQDRHPSYVVELSSMFGDELDRLEVSDTTVMVNLNGPELADEDNIVIRVYSKKDVAVNSKNFIIKKLSAADKNRLRKELEEIKSLIGEETALNQLYLASFYEYNTLYIDATTAYQRAIRMAPDVQDFREAFDEFVKRRLAPNGTVTR